MTEHRSGGLSPLSYGHKLASRRRFIHFLERSLLVVICAHLVLMPWALGTMWWETQLASAAVSGLGFFLSLWSRHYEDDDGRAYQLVLWPKLIKWPVFWIGLTVFCLIIVQGVNPSWRYIQSGPFWSLIRLKDVAWLPGGIEVPFQKFGVWRQLIIFSDGWFMACSIWVGFTSRRSLRVVMGVIAGNAVALALLLFVQHATGNLHFLGRQEYGRNLASPARSSIKTTLVHTSASPYL